MMSTMIRPQPTRVHPRATERAELESQWPELVDWFARTGGDPNDALIAHVPRTAVERWVDLVVTP